MCGICGFAGFEEPGLIESMTESLHHRGPDDFGFHKARGVSLGHRRLSIIDLEGGHQPIESPDGALAIVFNGEIYNYRELRAELEAAGHSFATRSDTEVLLRLFAVHREKALERLFGMFAFAVWDRDREELFLARDRVGIKPLYYVLLPGGVLFASETKALLRCGRWPRTLRAQAVHDYLVLRYVPGSFGMFREVRRLPAGHWMRWRAGAVEIRPYWEPPAPGGAHALSDRESLEELDALLEQSVRRRLITDVSFGAYLSGGLDSSVIVAHMARLSSAPIKTFSVGFGTAHDEVDQAAATARLLGCDHTMVECRSEDIALLPEIVYHSDEPMGDAINIPMYKLAREAKKKVTVILTGEGGDEVFAGYLFHKVMWAGDLYRRLVPRAVRDGAIRPLLRLAPATLLNLAFRYPAYLGQRGKTKALDYVDILGSQSVERGYRHLISLFDARDTEALFTPEFSRRLREEARDWEPRDDDRGSAFERMLRVQFDHWLPDNMLLRQDKMSMASAVEGRVPYLDHALVEFVLRLPRRRLLRRLAGKHILRRHAARLLPRETARRRKMPFYVPIENWFADPAFVAMMDDLLHPQSVRRRGIFLPDAVDALRRSMHRREFLLVKQVFSLMTLELWFRIFVDRGGRL